MGKPILEVEELTFKYDKRLEEETLSAVSFTVNKGEWLAIIGDNGSGKSTLAKLLVGLLEPQKGRICIAGTELTDDSKWEVRRHIGLVFQNPDNQFIGTTVQDDVAFGLENVNMSYEEMVPRVNEALRMVEMSAFCEHDPSRLSGGQKQRVAIAGILALKPSIIVLDESLVMLDPKSRRELLSTLNQLKHKESLTIISITHDMNEAAVSDRIMMMKSGRVLKSGPPAQIFIEEQQLEPPFVERLKRELENKGKEVPKAYTTEEEMVKWLCKSCLMV
ncbi:energy-coupling factor transporter ATPase [Aquibacillus halophilus]|uniref:Energy-coupling factor transporter ATPase n=1 Tax=Aquibacillus halophilus TaxID=930132 RepID=A0A6A8DH12_9BACI|nr:energy-coupling factor transporter ATPase [Aquibacillus halophilus]MRH44975.1 energy-coupling factor transporter ATPase [Aquibacillus halophilus]